MKYKYILVINMEANLDIFQTTETYLIIFSETELTYFEFNTFYNLRNYNILLIIYIFMYKLYEIINS